MSDRSPKILWPIDYSSMTYRLLIDYYTAHERHLLSCTICFRLWSIYLDCVRRIFPCIWTSCWRCRASSEKMKLTSTLTIIDFLVIDLWVFVCKVKLLRLRETSVISRYITSLSIECLYKFRVLAFKPNAIPLSFKSCIRTAIIIFSAGPCCIPYI